MTPPVCRDLDTLVPAFRARVEAVIADLRAQGFDAVVHETRRTPERAAWLKSKGTSKNGARSMHCYDCAADIISQAKGWDPPQGFWDALGASAHKHGLCWGGDWATFRDKPHVQAVGVREQDAIRALKSRDDVAEYVRQRLGG